MLVLTRKVGSRIIIDDNIIVQVLQIKGRQVRIGVTAPRETKVHREEIQLLQQNQLQMAQLKPKIVAKQIDATQ